MRNSWPSLAVAACVTAAMALPVGAVPASAAGSPEQALVERFYRDLSASRAAGRARPRDVIGAVRAAFDLPGLTRTALSDAWPALSPPQRQRAEALVGRLVALGIARGLEADRPRGLTVRGQRRVAAGVLVRTRVRARRGRMLAVQWLVVGTPTGPRIADLVIDGASVAVTRRSELASVWRQAKHDPEAFLARIETRLRRLEADRSGAR